MVPLGDTDDDQDIMGMNMILVVDTLKKTGKAVLL